MRPTEPYQRPGAVALEPSAIRFELAEAEAIELSELPYLCPKFRSCNAPVRALCSDCLSRTHRAGKGVCYYLLESVKADAVGQFDDYIEQFIYQLMVAMGPEIESNYPAIRRAHARSALAPSRRDREL